MTTETPTNISVFLRFKQVSQVAMLGGNITRVELELGGKPFYFDVPVSQQEAFMETLRQEMGQHGLVPPDVQGHFNDWRSLCTEVRLPRVGALQDNPQYVAKHLQSFLYELMRDVVTVGEVERVLQNIQYEDALAVRYSNTHLAAYALEVADTLVNQPKSPNTERPSEEVKQQVPPVRKYDEYDECVDINMNDIGSIQEELRKAKADPNYVAIFSSPVFVARTPKRKDSHCKEGCKCSRKQKEVDVTTYAKKAKDALNELFAKDPKLKKEHELCVEMLKEAEKNVAKEVADKVDRELGEAMRKEETYVPLRIHRFVLRHGTIPMLHIFSKDSRGEEAGLTLDNNVQDFIDACVAASNAQQVRLQMVASATPLEEVTHCVNKPLTLQLREVATPMGPSITLLRVGFGTHGASYIFRASPKGYLALVNIIEEQVTQKNWEDIEKESQKDSE